MVCGQRFVHPTANRKVMSVCSDYVPTPLKVNQGDAAISYQSTKQRYVRL